MAEALFELLPEPLVIQYIYFFVLLKLDNVIEYKPVSEKEAKSLIKDGIIVGQPTLPLSLAGTNIRESVIYFINPEKKYKGY